MNTLKSVLSIIFAIGMIFTIPLSQASETVSSITPETNVILSNSHTIQHLLQNTPKIGSLQDSWDDYAASINWADYLPSRSSSLSTNCRVAC